MPGPPILPSGGGWKLPGAEPAACILLAGTTGKGTMQTENRRTEGRVPTRFESLYSAGRTEGTGTLADISYSGALIEGTSSRPDIGSPLRIFVFIQPVSPVELVGEVVRHTEQGFAIEFSKLSEELKRFVDDVGAMVNVPAR
jgi:hypothetical protein